MFLLDRVRKRSVGKEDFRRSALACVRNAERVRSGMEEHFTEIPFLPAREKYKPNPASSDPKAGEGPSAASGEQSPSPPRPFP